MGLMAETFLCGFKKEAPVQKVQEEPLMEDSRECLPSESCLLLAASAFLFRK